MRVKSFLSAFILSGTDARSKLVNFDNRKMLIDSNKFIQISYYDQHCILNFRFIKNRAVAHEKTVRDGQEEGNETYPS